MAEYKGIKGFKVQYLDQDPVPSVAGWSAGGNMNTARYALGGTGLQTAALAFAGTTTPNAEPTTAEEYDGSTWTNGGSISTARTNLGSAGTQTAALGIAGYISAGGSNSAATEEYDGATWTAGGNVNTARRSLASAGTQTAGLAFGGYSTANVNVTEEYNGTSWTTSPGTLSTARRALYGSGTQTSALAFGGYITAVTGSTEEYNGSAWTAGGTMNTAAYFFAGSINGTQSSTLKYGGQTPTVTNETELYNGTSWTAASSLATAVRSQGGAGTGTSALSFGGYSTADASATEEYTQYGEPNTFQNVGQVWYNNTTKALKFTDQSLVGTIATGGNMNTGRGNHSAFGTATAGVAAGGFITGSSPPAGNVKSETEEYDGTSWTTSGAMGTAQYRGFGGGTQTAGFVASGRVYTPAVAAKPATEEYNGSTWTTGGSLSTARYFGAQGSGTQTAGIATAGGSDPSTNSNATEEYNGTSWTSGGTFPFSNQGIPGNGPQTAAITAGGYNPTPSDSVATSNQYDGTSWSANPNINTARGQGGTLGNSSAATLIGGGTPSVGSTSIENFDGTSWSTNSNSLPTGNISYNNAGVGTQAAGYVAGGSASYAITYEYVGGNVKGIKTVTVS